MFNFSQVDKHIYRGSAPSIRDISILKKKYNITKIISLDELSGKRIDRTCKLLNIKHIMLPIEIDIKSSLIIFLKHDIVKLLSSYNNGNTFIHCSRGKDRSGLAIALYRCEHDKWSAKKAIKEARSFGFGIGVDPRVVSLYLKIIDKAGKKNNKDNNSAYDIVSNERDTAQDIPGIEYDQLSWSPYEDYRVREFPFSPVDNNQPDQYATRQDYGLDSVQEVPQDVDMPQIGQLDGDIQNQNGFGPSIQFSGFE